MNAFRELCTLIGAKLEVISTDAGYLTELGETVNYEPWQLDESELPALVVIHGRFSRRSLATTVHERTVEILVQCSVPATFEDAQEIAGDALDDVIRALPAEFQVTLANGNKADVELQGGELVQRPNAAAFVVAQVTLEARLRER